MSEAAKEKGKQRKVDQSKSEVYKNKITTTVVKITKITALENYMLIPTWLILFQN